VIAEESREVVGDWSGPERCMFPFPNVSAQRENSQFYKRRKGSAKTKSDALTVLTSPVCQRAG
jgi:hypothetical protein